MTVTDWTPVSFLCETTIVCNSTVGVDGSLFTIAFVKAEWEPLEFPLCWAAYSEKRCWGEESYGSHFLRLTTWYHQAEISSFLFSSASSFPDHILSWLYAICLLQSWPAFYTWLLYLSISALPTIGLCKNKQGIRRSRCVWCDRLIHRLSSLHAAYSLLMKTKHTKKVAIGKISFAGEILLTLK